MQKENIKEEKGSILVTKVKVEKNNKFWAIFKTYCSEFKDSLNIKVIKSINRIESRFGYPLNNKLEDFDDLTPTIIKNEKTYTKALFWALKNQNVKNIALTGSYGSGKSSVIKTFKEKYKQFDYLNISLATFEECIDEIFSEPKPKTPEEIKQREELNQKIELSILQQMLYIEKSETLPNSRFKRIKNLKNHHLYINAFFLFLTVFGYIFLFQRELILKVCLTYNFFVINADILEMLSAIMLLTGIFYLLRNLSKTFSEFKFSKINLKEPLNAELNREIDDNSILNKNLDEIIYFFERTNYNVVFIEDLDRFKEPEIFTKLREINLLINLSKQVNRHIVFVYALKDEMFVDGNRTKFFDFIIPVIPVINSSNSYEILVDKLKDYKIDDTLLDDISLYIDDMRLLKNIINEFKIYHEKLSKETEIDLVAEKLFSFIIYKNLYPEDFAKLHKNEGMIYEFFNSNIDVIKGKIIPEKEEKINKELKVEIEKIENLKIKDKNELRRLYVGKIFEKQPQNSTFLKLKEKYTINQIDELISDQVFDEITKQTSYSFIENRFQYNSYYEQNPVKVNINFKQIENEVDSQFNYSTRVKLISDRENNQIDNYNLQIQNIREEINQLRRGSAEKVLKISNNLEDINEDLKKSDVLIYLIKKGFIAEDYFDYISLFYDLTMTRNDKNFILSIRNNKPLSIEFKLNKIDSIIKKINGDYHNESTLNIDLINHFLEKNDKAAIQELFRQFQNQTERINCLIESYIKGGKYLTEFIKAISKSFDYFWNFIELNSLSAEEKDMVLKEILLNVHSDDIIVLSEKSNLVAHISQKADFLNLMNGKSENLEQTLLKLDIKFSNPLETKFNNELFDFIYENSLYEINEKMIEQIIIEKCQVDDVIVKNLKTANYSTILKSNCIPLINYINDKIVDYMNNVFLMIETNVEETEKNIVDLLNNEKIDDDIKESIISKQATIIKSLVEVKSIYLWIVLLDENKTCATLDNIVTYFNQYEFDEYLIKFLNNEANYLGLKDLNLKDLSLDKEEKNKLILGLVEANSLTDEVYKVLLKDINYVVNDINFEKLGDSKIEFLINKGIIEFSKKTFESLRKSEDNMQMFLLAENFADFIELLCNDDLEVDNKIELEVNEIEALLGSKELINNQNKLQLIAKVSEDKISDKNNLAEIITEILINSNKIELSFEMFVELIKFSKTQNNKIKLANKYNSLFRDDNLKIVLVLNNLGTPYKEIAEGYTNKPPVIASLDNEIFIENLKMYGYIQSFSSKNGKITKIRKK